MYRGAAAAAAPIHRFEVPISTDDERAARAEVDHLDPGDGATSGIDTLPQISRDLPWRPTGSTPGSLPQKIMGAAAPTPPVAEPVVVDLSWAAVPTPGALPVHVMGGMGGRQP